MFQLVEKKKRVQLLTFGFIIIFFILIYRLFQIQIVEGSKLSELARKEHVVSYVLDGKRGAIFDRNMKRLAVNVDAQSLFAIPYKIENSDETAKVLAEKTGLKYQNIKDQLEKERYFVWIQRKLSSEKYQEIEELGLEGIDFVTESTRYYPKDFLAANLLGFVGIDNQGLEGLEMFFEKELESIPGLLVMERDASGAKIPLSMEKMQPSKDGNSIVLTIDEVLQYITEEALEEAYQQYRPKSAVAIVVNPKTGEILSLAVRPTYNLNNFQNIPKDLWKNRAITDSYEPGSTFKIFTIATALENNYASLNDHFNCKGSIRFQGTVIRDIDPHGYQDLTEVMKNSCNVGVIEVGIRMDEKIFADTIRNFGFGQLTDVQMPGEAAGLFRPVEQWSKLSIASLSIGQEISVTPLQLAMAMAAIANDGVLMKPLIVKQVLDSESNIIKEYHPEKVRQVISPRTALTMMNILKEVVDDGTGRRAMPDNYSAGGKTGTSQKFDFSLGRYSNEKFTSWFVGFTPSHDAELAILVMLDEPKGSYYGGTVAAPVFQEIATKALPYMSIPPE
ncbi:MAG: penicillin-binding transpeptidase domain-containing protein, partial [Atribacterota bacterium]|nr:penicillin-binding transpeptidase domain-containing protein [Atribacterota bacterium]